MPTSSSKRRKGWLLSSVSNQVVLVCLIAFVIIESMILPGFVVSPPCARQPVNLNLRSETLSRQADQTFDQTKDEGSPNLRQGMELYHEQQPHKNEAIPKLLHFVHVSGTLQRHTATYPSKEVLRNVEDWKAVHPTWTIRVWTNPQVIDNFPHLLPLLQALAAKQAPMSWLSDILRYAIIHRYGGVYLDTDVRPLRPLDPLLVLQNFTVCEEPRVRPRHYDPSHVQDLILGWRRCKLVGTAVVASTPQSPALWDALVSACSKSKTALEEAYNVSRILFRTDYSGPPLWTASARQQINPLFTETFFPCTWKKVSICVMSNFVNQSTSFAMHEWKKSWDGSTDAI